MIQMETVMLLTDHLRDVTWGVNAMLADVPRRAEHPAPPSIALIVDPYRDAQCARFDAPSKYPALYVLPDGPVPTTPEVATVYRDADVSVAVRYIVREENEDKSAIAAALTMKALERSFRAFFDDTAYGRTARGEDSGRYVYVMEVNTMRYGPWREAVGAAMAVQAFGLDLKVRDEAP